MDQDDLSSELTEN